MKGYSTKLLPVFGWPNLIEPKMTRICNLGTFLPFCIHSWALNLKPEPLIGFKNCPVKHLGHDFDHEKINQFWN